MLKLEEITKDAQITGLLPDEVVKVVNVEEIGPNARLVAYRNAQGKLDEQTIFRQDEHRLALAVAGLAWAFDADPAGFKLALEAYRISLAHLFDPLMAVHTSNVEPLPHQISAVYESMLPRQPLRFGFYRNKANQGQSGMAPLQLQLANTTLRRVIQRLHFPLEVMLVCVRWYAAYPLSLRQLEEMMAERGVCVDHATIHRWALKILPVLAAVFRTRKRSVGRSWQVDETYILVGGQWKYLYRAVDQLGLTVDFLLTARRDEAAARRFLERAIEQHDVPEKITIDKSAANTAAVRGLMNERGLEIELRQSKYLNNLVEQDHRAIKRRVRPMLGLKSFWTARRILAGIETMHMIRKGQMNGPQGSSASAAQQFYSLAH